MKKYLFGILALALAVGFSAFTKPTTKSARTANEKVFRFDGNASSSLTQVEDPTKWVYDELATPEFNCADGEDIPCGILVSEEFYHADNSTFKLNDQGYLTTTYPGGLPTGVELMEIAVDNGAAGKHIVAIASTTAEAVYNTED